MILFYSGFTATTWSEAIIRTITFNKHNKSQCKLKNQLIALILSISSLSSVQLIQSVEAKSDLPIRSPKQARQHGLESLRYAIWQDGGVPLPDDLDDFIKDRHTAIQLGKALFWDMQIGSDGVQACGSCHFHAGADNRATNQLNPNTQSIVNQHNGDVEGYFSAPNLSDLQFDTRQPDETLKREDFPFVKSIQDLTLNSDGSVRPGLENSNDIASSMGMFLTLFDGINLGSSVEFGRQFVDTVFQGKNGESLRRVEPRNTPTVINAVFNFSNFWEGRANPHFNGANAFGDQDPGAAILVNDPTDGLAFQQISLANASLASQAVSPTVSFTEMSFFGRSFPDIGMKMLRRAPENGTALKPLGLQKVHRRDSVLGSISNAPRKGLRTSYEAMIKKAFVEKYWNSDELIDGLNDVKYTHMEANFSLFFGLSVALYESTLVSDRSPFDRWMETGRFNRGFRKKQLAGLNLFINEGKCITCHQGPEFTSASVRAAEDEKNTIRAMAMAQGMALYDNGFYNISVTPTTDDIGRGDRDPFGQPLAFSRQALFNRLDIAQVNFPIIGDNHIPALDEDLHSSVCTDNNANGTCELDEAINSEFQRVAVDGAFKTPGLRNVELTGPFFHNGGVATLRQVVQFYNRGGNFCQFNLKDLDPAIEPLDLTPRQEKQLVAFLVSLTDKRVKYKRAPFDHPEIMIPRNGQDQSRMRKIRAVGSWGSYRKLKPFLHLNQKDEIFTPLGVCSKN